MNGPNVRIRPQILLIYHVRKTHLFPAILKLAGKRANVLKKVYQKVQCNVFKKYSARTRRKIQKAVVCLHPKRFGDSAAKRAHAWSRVTETVPCRQKDRVASHYRIIINNDDDNDDL